jgi:molecular chaperone GrpE
MPFSCTFPSPPAILSKKSFWQKICFFALLIRSDKMTRHNRKEIVEQEKNQAEEISEFKKMEEVTSGIQDEQSNSNEAPIPNAADTPVELTSSDEDSSLKMAESRIAEMNDRYLRLSAEFDNYRKRTIREKSELIKSAGEDILSNILPVLDNFERALAAIKGSSEPEAIKAGIVLIYGKFKEFLTQRGIKEIESLNKPFDAELHDAITKIPVNSKEQQGQVIDVVEKGYYLNDKIIRHSKVVVGEYTEPGNGATS